MSMENEYNSLETVDLDVFLEQLSSSQREVLVDSLHLCLETNNSGGIPIDDFDDLHDMKESDANEGASKSGNEGGICCASMTPNSPSSIHGVVELQPTTEDLSFFLDLAQTDVYSSPSNQSFRGHDMLSSESSLFWTNREFRDQTVHPSPETFDLYHPIELESPDEAQPTGTSQGLGAIVVDSDTTLSFPINGFLASQQPRSDMSRLISHPSKTTVPDVENSSAAVSQIQVVKTEEWPTAEVSEGEFDAKKERRRLQNRKAAMRCRTRKKESYECMLKAAQKMKLENVDLQKQVQSLREQLKCIMDVVKLHQTHCGLQLTLSQRRRPDSADPS